MKTPVRTVLVDDDAAFVQTLSELLAVGPLIDLVGTAQTGAEALEQVSRLRPDLVLMDLNMPDIDGFVLTSKIKAMPEAPRVIILTGHDHRDFRAAAEAVQADGFISKLNVIKELGPLLQSLPSRT